MIYKTSYQSPIGNILLASDGKSLVGLWIEKQKYFASSVSTEMVNNPDLKVFQDTKNWLERYFANKKPEITEVISEKQCGKFFAKFPTEKSQPTAKSLKKLQNK